MRFLLALALMIFCSTAVVAQDLPDTTSELFQLADQDYSIGALERIFGGIVAYVVEGDEAAAETGSLISSAVAILNLVVLGLATIIGLYSVLALTADTASDGTALGRSTDTKYTFLRAGIAAVFLLPIKGGFTVIQLIGIYLMVWGAGLADTTWEYFASKTLTADSYVGPPNLQNNEGWRMRGQLADATYALVNGNLCARHMNRLANSYGTADTVTLRPNEYTQTYRNLGDGTAIERKYFEMYFRSGNASRNSNDLCGNVRYYISYTVSSYTDGFAADEVRDMQSQLSLLARENVYQSTRSALLNIVEPRARALAERIDSGSGDGLRDDNAIQDEIKSIAEAAANAIYTSRVSDTTFSDSRMQDIQEGIQESVTKNGWMMAALWQRGLSDIFTKLKDIRTSLEIEANADNRITSIFGTGVFSHFFSSNSVSRASFEPVERDFEYLETFVPFIAKLHQPDADGASSSVGQGAGSDLASQTLTGVYVWLLDWFRPEGGEATFKDPFVEYADAGSSLVIWGGGIFGGTSLLQAAVDDIPVVGAIVGVGTGPVIALGYYLLAIGVIFMIIIPSIPILYYFSAAISWLLLCVESVFALPIAVLLWFAPAREPSLIGPWHKVVLTMTGLLMRPFFAVVGLIVCIIILWIGNEILGIIFGSMLGVMTPDWGIMSVVMMLGLIGIYAMTTIFLALHASSVITILGDSVMGWIGAQMSPITKDGIGDNAAQVGRGQAMNQAPSGGMLQGGVPALQAGGRALGKPVNNRIKGLISKE